MGRVCRKQPSEPAISAELPSFPEVGAGFLPCSWVSVRSGWTLPKTWHWGRSLLALHLESPRGPKLDAALPKLEAEEELAQLVKAQCGLEWELVRVREVGYQRRRMRLRRSLQLSPIPSLVC